MLWLKTLFNKVTFKSKFGQDQDLYYGYSCEPLVVLDESDLSSVKVAVRQRTASGVITKEWVPKTTSHVNIWDFNRTQTYLDELLRQRETDYINQMSNIASRRKEVETWYFART